MHATPRADGPMDPPHRKRVAIVQSSYIPWKGYFDLIRSVDEFILLDEVQFTKRDWRNRNRIKTQHGLMWLTVPVHTKGKFTQRIQDTLVSDGDWSRKHWATIRAAYAKAPCFSEFEEPIAALYRASEVDGRLSDVNYRFLTAICEFLEIRTPIRWSTDYHSDEGRNDRLIALCSQAGATDYLSGPSAAAYIDQDQFAASGISVQYADYSGYPEYPQPYPPFEHHVSVLDLLFSTGRNAPQYLKQL
jgi:hypothetical protein